MDTIIWIWLAIAVVFGIVEILTMDLATIWFVFGSVVAMIFASMGLSFYWQLAAFLIISILLLLFTRPIVVKKLNIGKTKTNADSLVGKVCLITEKTDVYNNVGRAKIKGQSWAVRPKDASEVFEVGEMALVDSIEGVKLIIIKNNNKED